MISSMDKETALFMVAVDMEMILSMALNRMTPSLVRIAELTDLVMTQFMATEV